MPTKSPTVTGIEDVRATRVALNKLRVLFWYAFLETHSGVQSAYALERILMPETCARPSAVLLSHSNRMARYARGKHVPRARLVMFAEDSYPGSRHVLEHPLWQILDPAQDPSTNRYVWSTHMGPRVAAAMYIPRPGAPRCPSRRAIRDLENVADLDALAGLALGARDAIAERDAAGAFACTRGFWIALLLTANDYPIDAVRALCRLAGACLFDNIQYGAHRVALGLAPIELCVSLLKREWNLSGEYRIGRTGCTRSQNAKHFQLGLLRSEKRRFAFHVAAGLCTMPSDAVTSDMVLAIEFEKYNRTRQAALDYICTDDWTERGFFSLLLGELLR